MRGYNKHTVNEDLSTSMTQLMESHRQTLAGAGANLSQEQRRQASQQLENGTSMHVADLIREDWQAMVTTFYFPRLGKCITDDRLRDFIDHTNKELLEPNQEVKQIKMVAEKAHRFLLSNIWILEVLIEDLKAE